MKLPAEEEKLRLRFEAGRVFTPATPVDEKDLFAGRRAQLNAVIDAISQRGQHVIIFGERGVGKSSLANVIPGFLRAAEKLVLSPRVNCDSSDTYSTLWRKVFHQIVVSKEKEKPGFRGEKTVELETMLQQLPKKISPDLACRTLSDVSSLGLLIVIIDEFDRMDKELTRVFADTIKMLSDHAVPATIILVGVADSVDQLIEEHESIERSLVQVALPRMTSSELHEIVSKGLQRLALSIEPSAINHICRLSQGLPHYTHLLGLYSVHAAIEEGKKEIGLRHVNSAIEMGISKAQASIMDLYHKATKSPRKESLFPRVLLACALAKSDELGYFSAGDIRKPLGRIMGKPYEIPLFARHLHDFCEPARGPALHKKGEKYSIRYRFTNPLLQPYVIMKGLASGLVNPTLLEELG